MGQPPTVGLGTLTLCALSPVCQDALLAGAVYVGLVTATHYFAQKRDIQFARDVASAVEKICGPGRVTPDQIHDLLHWGHYGSFGEAVNDIVAIVCPEKAGGAR